VFTGIHQHDQLKLNEKQQELFKQTTVSALYPEYYLIKINQFNDVAKDPLDEWIYFLKHEEIKKLSKN
jgi:nucleoside 2-deoxyribosyltransferase